MAKKVKELKAITKKEAQEFDNTKLKDQSHREALEEAVEKINTTIKMHYKALEIGNMAATSPIQNCTQYIRLMDELKQMYNPNGFDINWAPNSPVLTIRLFHVIQPMTDEQIAQDNKIEPQPTTNNQLPAGITMELIPETSTEKTEESTPIPTPETNV